MQRQKICRTVLVRHGGWQASIAHADQATNAIYAEKGS